MNETPQFTTESVLCVDLDGTLSRTDTLIETLLMLVKQRPLAVLLLPFWLMRGRAGFKAAVAQAVRFDPEDLAYNQDLIDWLRAEKAAGRVSCWRLRQMSGSPGLLRRIWVSSTM